MAIEFFKKDLFIATENKPITTPMPLDMVEFLDRLQEVMGFDDRSKTVRWCIEQIAKDAVTQEIFKKSAG